MKAFPSSYISALYVKEKYPELKKVITVGTKTMLGEFQKLNFDARSLDDI